MGKEQILQQIGLAAVAGVIGAAAAHAMRTANQKLVPEAVSSGSHQPETPMPPEPRGPARESAPGGVRAATSALFPFGYAPAGVALYSAVRENPKVLRDGIWLGTGLWALDYLGVIPGQRKTERTAGQQTMALAQHLLFGVATVGAYRRLQKALA
jgi:hypothetical protein